MCCVKLLLLFLGSLVGCQANKIVVANTSFGVDSYELVTNPCQDVRLAGFICVDCSTLGFCSNVGNQWQTVSMTECQTERGFYCSDEGTFGCTWQPRCTVPVRGKFYCQQPGTYPDPYDCRSYHECSEQNVDTPRQCTNGAAYSLLTYTCSLPRESELCTEKQYDCSYVGQTGVWAANSSYYYICQKDTQGSQDVFYPLMMKCKDGYIFNGHTCISAPKSPMSLMSRLSACENGILYPSNKANGYYSCTNGKLTFDSCPAGFYFESTVSACLKLPQSCVEGMLYPAETKYGFHFCLAGTLYYQKCPVGSYFDLTRNICLSEETCLENETYAAENENGFYFCYNGEFIYTPCPKNSIYDAEKASCKLQHSYN